MDEMEFNKIFAAILVAGIIAMFTGFLADNIVHEEPLHEDAYAVEALEGGVGGATPAAPQGPEPILAMLASASVEKGEALSRACAACHDFSKGGANRVGPALWGVVGAKKAAHAGFSYSDDLTSAGGTWTYQDLNAFLWKPKKVYPGTKMNFAGLKKPEDRAALIAWLRTLDDSPQALPTASDIAAEAAEAAPAEADVEAEAADEQAEH